MKQVILIVGFLVVFSILLSGGFIIHDPQQFNTIPTYVAQLVDEGNTTEHRTLQIQAQKVITLTPAPSISPTAAPTPTPTITATPTPGGTCGGEGSGTTCSRVSQCPVTDPYLVTCEDGRCKDVKYPDDILDRSKYYPNPHGKLTCAEINGGINYPLGWCDPRRRLVSGNGTFCMAKPVIYLYPEKDTYVDVSLSIPGTITKSIPEYGNGWKKVLAHPNGKLEYKGKSYNELFYESEVTKVNPPRNGIMIPKSELKSQLSQILSKLGLNRVEKDEFLDYWMSPLLNLKGNYILFSVLETQEKERVDGVHIFPEPDTRIELLIYFKPLEYPVSIKPLILPENPPERKGFTEVEWGGTIDTR